MKTFEIIDQILSRNLGGVKTNEDKFAERAIEALFPKWLQKSWDVRYNGNRTQGANTFIGAQNYVSCHLTFSSSLQVANADFALFEIEPPISLNGTVNGISFLGDELTGKPFTQFKSLQTYNTAKDAGLISINEVYFENSGNNGNILKVWGSTQLKQFFLNYIPANVYNCIIYDYKTKTNRQFNPAIDDYPISQDILGTFLDIAAGELFPEVQMTADYKADSAPVQITSK